VHHTAKYTIMEIGDAGSPPCWVAAPRMDIEIGDRVAYADAVEVPNFHSETLGRTFEQMLLAMYLFKVHADGRLIAANPHASAKTLAGPFSTSAGARGSASNAAEKGRLGPTPAVCTVAEVASRLESLAGQDVSIRGVVTSATYNVRPTVGQPLRNWYRLRDQLGSGEALAVCGEVVLKQGETVVIRGTLAVNKRFDAHVAYPAIVEDAKLVPQIGPQL
jgi:hypothetical protein